jgi:hypothetical protein
MKFSFVFYMFVSLTNRVLLDMFRMEPALREPYKLWKEDPWKAIKVM